MPVPLKGGKTLSRQYLEHLDGLLIEESCGSCWNAVPHDITYDAQVEFNRLRRLCLTGPTTWEMETKPRSLVCQIVMANEYIQTRKRFRKKLKQENAMAIYFGECSGWNHSVIVPEEDLDLDVNNAIRMNACLSLLEMTLSHVQAIIRRYPELRDVKILTYFSELIAIFAWKRDVKGLVDNLTRDENLALQPVIDIIENQWSAIEKSGVLLEFWYWPVIPTVEPIEQVTEATNALTLAQMALKGYAQEGRAVSILNDENISPATSITRTRSPFDHCPNDRYPVELDSRHAPQLRLPQPPPPYIPYQPELGQCSELNRMNTPPSRSPGSVYHDMRRGRWLSAQSELP